MLKRKISAFLAGILTVTLAGNVLGSESQSQPESWKDAFIRVYKDIANPSNGYFDNDGLPYYALEELLVDKVDYGHLTTSETVSYYMWLEAMYGRITGDWIGLKKAWEVTEKAGMIPSPSQQPGNSAYNPTNPCMYMEDSGSVESFPVPLNASIIVGKDPIYRELVSAYGTSDIYGMHWLSDLDNWYGFGNETKATFIDTYKRGPEESVWHTIPHPSMDDFKFGGKNGFIDLFVKDTSYAKQWSYRTSSIAESTLVQAMYWANKWSLEQGKSGDVRTLVQKGSRIGDYLRYAMFDKYFKKIGGSTGTSGAGYDSATYLYSSGYSWGGDINGMWSLRKSSNNNNIVSQNPFAAWALANISDMKPKSLNGVKDNRTSLDRQLEYYTWLQSAEGAIGGGSTNSWNGKYEKVPQNISTFYGMGYMEEPGDMSTENNTYFYYQTKTMLRLAELYLETENQLAKDILDKWIEWVKPQIMFIDNEVHVPLTLEWEGQPDTWSGMRSENKDFHTIITSMGKDLGIIGSIANVLTTYSAATQKFGNLDEESLNIAQRMLKVAWNEYRDDKGFSMPEIRPDYTGFDEKVFVPSGWSGKMPNGDVIKPGIRFMDIRTKYLNNPEFNRGSLITDISMKYHRFIVQSEMALAYGKMAACFEDSLPPVEPLLGDINEDGIVDSTDYALVKRYILGISLSSNYDYSIADMNSDGKINSIDVVLMKRKILGL